MRAAKILIALPATLLAAFLLAEVGIRATYVYALHRTAFFPMLYERVYWSDVPPWVRYASIFNADPEVGLWMKPNLDRRYINLFGPIGDLHDVDAMFTRLSPVIPAWARDRPVWRLTTNALGIRNADVSPAKPPGTFRIIAMGDSWTVGVNLDVEQTWVRRLATALGEGIPAGRVEVINYGVIGGKAETGRRLADRVLRLDPDLVVVAYAANDEEAVRAGTSASGGDGRRSLWSQALDQVESYKLFHHLRARTPGAIEAGLREGITTTTRNGDNDRRAGCSNPRANESPYRSAIESLVDAARGRHVDVVLLYDNLPEVPSHCTLAVLSDLAATRDLPLVDASALLAAKRAQLEADAERQRDLVPPAAERRGWNTSTVVFRVDMGGRPGKPRVMGNLPGLGNLQPNAVELFDDGTHGDQRADDGIWSLAVPMRGFQRIVYLYTSGDTPGSWTQLENYQPRVFSVTPENAGATIYTPIAEYGHARLRSDPAHPDAAGAAVIADTLAETIRSRPAWHAWAASQAGVSAAPAPSLPARRPRARPRDSRSA